MTQYKPLGLLVVTAFILNITSLTTTAQVVNDKQTSSTTPAANVTDALSRLQS